MVMINSEDYDGKIGPLLADTDTSKRADIGSREEDECPTLVTDEIRGQPRTPLSLIEEFCWERHTDTIMSNGQGHPSGQ